MLFQLLRFFLAIYLWLKFPTILFLKLIYNMFILIRHFLSLIEQKAYHQECHFLDQIMWSDQWINIYIINVLNIPRNVISIHLFFFCMYTAYRLLMDTEVSYAL